MMGEGMLSGVLNFKIEERKKSYKYRNYYNSTWIEKNWFVK